MSSVWTSQSLKATTRPRAIANPRKRNNLSDGGTLAGKFTARAEHNRIALLEAIPLIDSTDGERIFATWADVSTAGAITVTVESVTLTLLIRIVQTFCFTLLEMAHRVAFKSRE